MQPVSLLMSHMNVENTARTAPNALAAAQDTAQGQELVKEGIRAVQTVQASEAASNAQKVKRKNSNDEKQEGQEQKRKNKNPDSFERSSEQEIEKKDLIARPILENVKVKKGFDFTC